MAVQKVSTFKDRFRSLCEENPTSDSKLADRLHVSKQTISAWKSGIRSPKEPTIIAIASFFNVSVKWLMGFDVSREPADDRTRYASDPMPPSSRVGKKDEPFNWVNSNIRASAKVEGQKMGITDKAPQTINIGASPEKKLLLFRALGKLATKDPESAAEILAALSENDII